MQYSVTMLFPILVPFRYVAFFKILVGIQPYFNSFKFEDLGRSQISKHAAVNEFVKTLDQSIGRVLSDLGLGCRWHMKVAATP